MKRTRVYFAVPTDYTIGDEYETFEEAVAEARDRIEDLRPRGLDYDTREFVDVRVADENGDRPVWRVEVTREGVIAGKA